MLSGGLLGFGLVGTLVLVLVLVLVLAHRSGADGDGKSHGGGFDDWGGPLAGESAHAYRRSFLRARVAVRGVKVGDGGRDLELGGFWGWSGDHLVGLVPVVAFLHVADPGVDVAVPGRLVVLGHGG